MAEVSSMNIRVEDVDRDKVDGKNTAEYEVDVTSQHSKEMVNANEVN